MNFDNFFYKLSSNLSEEDKSELVYDVMESLRAGNETIVINDLFSLIPIDKLSLQTLRVFLITTVGMNKLAPNRVSFFEKVYTKQLTVRPKGYTEALLGKFR